MSPGKRRWIAGAGVAALVLTLASGAVAAVMNTDPSTPPAVPPGSNLQSMPDIQHRPVVLTAVYTTPKSKAATIKLVPGALGISSVALTAYQRAAHLEARTDPSCRLPWQLVAAIGYIESDHGQYGGDSLDARGNETTPLEGIPLDGTPGVARIVDGHGHPVRAEGPLQFIPSTWKTWGVDANGDHHQDPQNIFDASAAAAAYLCSSGQDLSFAIDQPPAITLYNDSPIYVENVINVERAYLAGQSADTVTLIPMPTCPDPNATPSPSPTPTPTPTPGAPACPTPTKKPAKAKTKTVVAARPHPVVEAPRPTPSPTRTPTPSPAPTPSLTPTPQPTPTSTP